MLREVNIGLGGMFRALAGNAAMNAPKQPNGRKDRPATPPARLENKGGMRATPEAHDAMDEANAELADDSIPF